MAKQKGRTLLVKIGDGASPEVFNVLCGLTSKTFSINNSEIDVTTADCDDPAGVMWTEVLDGAKRISLSGNGYFEDSETEERAREVAMDPTPIANFQVIVPDFGTFEGAFFFATLDYSGEQEGGVTYSLSLSSTGPIAWTAAA